MKALFRKYAWMCMLVPALFLSLVHTASAHSNWSLQRQISSCDESSWWSSAYQTVVVSTCGYGTAEFGNVNLMIARDTATDTHCQYTRKYDEVSRRYVELKSCGSVVKHRINSQSSRNRELGNCITGHWFCYWSYKR